MSMGLRFYVKMKTSDFFFSPLQMFQEMGTGLGHDVYILAWSRFCRTWLRKCCSSSTID